MIRGDRRRLVCRMLLVMNLAVIWGNSLLPAEISSQISGFVAELLGKLLNSGAGEGQEGHGLLRKMAHFSEFASLGMLLTWRFTMDGRRGQALFCQTLLGGIFAACVDETIQLFADGRSSSLIDVWIDTFGAAAGMLIFVFGHHLIQNRKKRKYILEETI